MSYVFRNACKLCQKLQRSRTVSNNLHYQFYSKSLRGIATSYNDLYSSKSKPIAVMKDDSREIFQSFVEDMKILQNVEHDIVDKDSFDYLKETYLDRLKEFREMNNEIKEEENPKTSKRKRKRKSTTPQAVYERGNQMTVHGEQNVLAEIDIYIYLREFAKAVNLFNFHRRHGHRFGVDSYNKIIHVWAARKGWKNIQLLLHSMQKEGIEMTYQTYAGLLEACGTIGTNASVHVENLLNEMLSKNMNVKEVLSESQLTKHQIESIFNALHLANEKSFNNGGHKRKEFGNGSLSNRIQVQIEQELKGSIVIKSIEKSKVLQKSVLKRSDLYQNIIAKWRKDFILEMTLLRQTKDKKGFLYNRCVSYGSVLTPDELSDIVFESIIPVIASQPQGIPVGYICRILGEMIYTRFCLKFQERNGVVEKVNDIANEFCVIESPDEDAITPRMKWKEISEKSYHLPSDDLLPSPWSKKIRTMASSVVLDILKKVATVHTGVFLRGERGTIENSLYHQHEVSKKMQVGILKFHPAICRLYSCYLSHVGNMSFEVNRLPMVIPPKPWRTPKSGGYLLLHSDFVRTITRSYKVDKLSNSRDVNKIFDALNYVGNCAWKVNGRLLDIMIELFNGKGDMKLDIIGSDLPAVESWNNKKKLTLNDRNERRAIKKEFHELFALRMDLLYKLSVANHFRNDVLWIPNNLDFRGRIYPIAPHCCHIGNDVSRSMLMFAEGKKLGKKGLDWLKVHLINVHGQLKKASLEERIKYADSHIDNIMDSADNPLTGCKWWQNSSDPWQTLIACMEITDAIRSGDPDNFVSHLPVQQDGSCNGLQHYAALGRDLYGAKQVNLIPADKPQDVYAEVSNLVEKRRQEDALNGVLIAQQLVGKINRKVVKQTVMTVVYGVTFVGGRLQIEKQLKDLNVENDIIFKASVYIVQEVFKSLTEMFTSAKQIQDWLTISAAQIALSGNCVAWVTPLNLPVVQPYHKKTVESIATPIQRVVSTHSFDYTQIPNLTKQKRGLPPNFIHSLDSTHMMLTALRCQQEKMVFASVHDSFWTHGCDVDKMNRFCREEFIHLHKLPILEDLKKYFEECYSELPLRKPLKDGRTVSKFDDLPKLGAFDIDEVLNSVYFFS